MKKLIRTLSLLLSLLMLFILVLPIATANDVKYRERYRSRVNHIDKGAYYESKWPDWNQNQNTFAIGARAQLLSTGGITLKDTHVRFKLLNPGMSGVIYSGRVIPTAQSQIYVGFEGRL